jgi:LacI family transcriptional regulator
MRKTLITIKDVAAASGVHASTVSRALNDETRDMVSKPVADKVLAVARKLGYLRNPLASGLRTRRSHTIGVLIPDLTNPVFPPIIRGIERTLAAAGYVAVLADSDSDERNAHAIVENLLGRQVDGLILATAYRKDPVVDKCIEHGIPLVLINRVVDKIRVAAVVNDDDFGIRLALEHLLGLGHRQIAFVGGPQNTSTGYYRYLAFLAATKEHGLKIDRSMIVNGKSFSEAEGQSCLSRIIDAHGNRFTAVVAANDLLALGCFDALNARGMRCPDDVSVSGFNHMPFVDRFSPSLTTVHIPHDELGVQAAKLLLERIRNPEDAPKTIRLKPSMVLGGSTRNIAVRDVPAREVRPKAASPAKTRARAVS